MSKKAVELSNQFVGHPYEADEDFSITLARSAYRQGYVIEKKAFHDVVEKAGAKDIKGQKRPKFASIASSQ